MKVCRSLLTYRDDHPLALENIRLSSEHVDETHVVADDTYDEPLLQELRSVITAGTLTQRTFDDDFVKQCTVHVDIAKESGVDWVVLAGADEFFCPELWRDLRSIIDRAEKAGSDVVEVNARDQFDTGPFTFDLAEAKSFPVSSRPTDYWKPLICKLWPDFRYTADGYGKCHCSWGSKSHLRRTLRADGYHYVHRKSRYMVWKSSARNLFMGGGGANIGKRNPYWVLLRNHLKSMNVTTFRGFEDVLEGGSGRVPDILVDWMNSALLGGPISGMDSWTVSEIVSTAWLFYLHHPEFVTPTVRGALEGIP